MRRSGELTNLVNEAGAASEGGDWGQDRWDSGQREEVLEAVEMNRMGWRGREEGKDWIYESVAPNTKFR